MTTPYSVAVRHTLTSSLDPLQLAHVTTVLLLLSLQVRQLKLVLHNSFGHHASDHTASGSRRCCSGGRPPAEHVAIGFRTAPSDNKGNAESESLAEVQSERAVARMHRCRQADGCGQLS